MLHNLWTTLLELAPWLLLGMLVAGLLHGLLPAGFVARALGGRRGVWRAVALGVPLPLCSCGVIPAGVGLRRDGASRGATVGFLISTPQTGVDSLLVSASMLGWPFALFKVVSAFVTGLFGGWLTDRLLPESAAPPAAVPGAPGARPSWRAMWAHALEILESFWHWLVFGVVVSAALTTWLPPEALSAGLVGHPLGALLVALAISLPLYVCATASVPIAAALVASGFPPGAALVFLMAGPATNLATMGAVRKALGGRVFAIYLATIIVGSLGFGLLFDFVLASEGAPAAGHEHGDLWATPFAVLLLGLLVFVGARDLRNRLRTWRLKGERVEGMAMGVEGMTCGGCASRLQAALAREPNVHSAQVLLEEKRAVVSGPIDRARLARVIREAGFTPQPEDNTPPE